MLVQSHFLSSIQHSVTPIHSQGFLPSSNNDVGVELLLAGGALEMRGSKILNSVRSSTVYIESGNLGLFNTNFTNATVEVCELKSLFSFQKLPEKKNLLQLHQIMFFV